AAGGAAGAGSSARLGAASWPQEIANPTAIGKNNHVMRRRIIRWSPGHLGLYAANGSTERPDRERTRDDACEIVKLDKCSEVTRSDGPIIPGLPQEIAVPSAAGPPDHAGARRSKSF